ncbi:MAG: NifB/NifX family molybdenum-iron cluster-binding protein [Desulfobacterales bacterium]
MRVAVTAWEDRISPVFDSARSLLIADIENELVVDRQYKLFAPEPVSRLADLLRSLEIEVLICGAIAQTPSNIIEASGIKLISFIGGKIDDILKSYAKNGRIVPEFLMPGCARQFRRKRRGRHAVADNTVEVMNMLKRDGAGMQGVGRGKGKEGGKTDRGGQGGRRCIGLGRGGSQGPGRGRKKGNSQKRGQGKGDSGTDQNKP